MEFENTKDKLETLEIQELIRLYIETSHYDSFNKELIELVKIEHDYLYGMSKIEYLDIPQIDHLHNQIGLIILNKLSEQYEEGIFNK